MDNVSKTNVMRVLDQKGIAYRAQKWADIKVQDITTPIYKTLVTQGKSKEHYVFVIPTTHELDLKKAAKSVNEKSIQMIKEKELLPLTGYVHGGCSPIGMKKEFKTMIDEAAVKEESIFISAGKVGYSIEVNPKDLKALVGWQAADIATDN